MSTSNNVYESTTRIANAKNLKASPDLFNHLIEKGLLIKELGKYQLTKKGVEIGGIYQANSRGEKWVAWKENSLNEIIDTFLANKTWDAIENSQPLLIDFIDVSEIEYSDGQFMITCFVKDNTEFYYELKHIFNDEGSALSIANKIEEKGLIDPTYWRRIIDENDNNENYVSNEYDMRDVYNDFVIEDDEPTYLCDGMWLYPDGSMRDSKN